MTDDVLHSDVCRDLLTGLGTLAIGGVAAAVALCRAGIEATVYERATEIREVGAGMMLWPNATRVLKELGLLERVAASSGPNRHFLVRGRGTGSLRHEYRRADPQSQY